MSFDRNQNLNLKRLPEQLQLSIDTYKLSFDGFSEERYWLEQVLQDELGLAVE